jgi:hypothetical protein
VGEGDGVGFVVFWGVDSWSCHNNGLNMIDVICEEGGDKSWAKRWYILGKKKHFLVSLCDRTKKELILWSR